jgi:integrase
MVEAIKDKQKIDVLLMYLKGKNERDWLLAKCQLNMGLRISDIVDIKVSDIMHESLKFRDYFKTREQKTHKS